MHPTTIHPQEKTAQLVWTAFILMFFVLQAILWIFAISFTSGDASHAVVAGYDKQALHWDEVKQVQQASKMLGWRCNLLVDPVADVHGNRVVTLQLFDRHGNPVAGAKIEVDAFHQGAAAEVQVLAFKEVAAGVYTTKAQVTKFGRWRFSGTAVLEESNFLIEHQTQLIRPVISSQPSISKLEQ